MINTSPFTRLDRILAHQGIDSKTGPTLQPTPVSNVLDTPMHHIISSQHQPVQQSQSFQQQQYNTTSTSGMGSILRSRGIHDVVVSDPPPELQQMYDTCFTPDAVGFISDLNRVFEHKIDDILLLRKKVQEEIEAGKYPDFKPETKHIREGTWTISPLPEILLDRRIDIGDITPSDPVLLLNALKSGAEAVQVDFDDGYCPTWQNMIKSYFHLKLASHDQLEQHVQRTQPNSTQTSSSSSNRSNGGFLSYFSQQKKKDAFIMCRPRAWNMRERHFMVGGREMMGALVDFAMHMFHNGEELRRKGKGPFFYLSKVESQEEARLWNDIFTYTEQRLGMPSGTIRACVLIENITASFQTHEILYELRAHAMGLNCGMWDYAASIVSKFRHDHAFVISERSLYVTMKKRFMASYRKIVIQTCHMRGAIATGGMTPWAAVTPLSSNASSYEKHERNTLMQTRGNEIEKAIQGKIEEMLLGCDGCLVSDLELVEPLHQAWEKHIRPKQTNYHPYNQINVIPQGAVTQEDLLAVPKGTISITGLIINVTVGILFIESWYKGNGFFVLKGKIEDSATAEISRSQVWQWQRHNACLTDGRVITRSLVKETILHVLTEEMKTRTTQEDKARLRSAARMFEHIVHQREFPPFITSFLYDQEVFWHHSDAIWL